jgi:DNA-binding IclR family transcriptional regulator
MPDVERIVNRAYRVLMAMPQPGIEVHATTLAAQLALPEGQVRSSLYWLLRLGFVQKRDTYVGNPPVIPHKMWSAVGC